MVNDFWKQPAKGFTTETIGRTEEQIQQIETSIGFKFPKLYREHMKLQNGGNIRKGAIKKDNEIIELFYGASVNPINEYYNTVRGCISEYFDEDQIKEEEEKSKAKTNSGYCDLNRLPIISGLDGHTLLCLDYGYKLKAPLTEPEICVFDLDEMQETFRIKSYEELVKNLVYYGYESESFYFGIRSSEEITELSKKISEYLNIKLTLKESNRQGWFNFKQWYSGEIKTRALILHLILSPNKHLSGTYLFQDKPEFEYILEVIPMIGNERLKDNSNNFRAIIGESLEKVLNEYKCELLLYPYRKEI